VLAVGTERGLLYYEHLFGQRIRSQQHRMSYIIYNIYYITYRNSRRARSNRSVKYCETKPLSVSWRNQRLSVVMEEWRRASSAMQEVSGRRQGKRIPAAHRSVDSVLERVAHLATGLAAPLNANFSPPLTSAQHRHPCRVDSRPIARVNRGNVPLLQRSRMGNCAWRAESASMGDVGLFASEGQLG
jgi:hypothetical protein